MWMGELPLRQKLTFTILPCIYFYLPSKTNHSVSHVAFVISLFWFVLQISVDQSMSRSKNIQLLYNHGNNPLKIQPVFACAVPTDLWLPYHGSSHEGPLETKLVSTSTFSLRRRGCHRPLNVPALWAFGTSPSTCRTTVCFVVVWVHFCCAQMQSTADHRILAFWSAGYFWLRLLPYRWPRASCKVPRTL